MPTDSDDTTVTGTSWLSFSDVDRHAKASYKPFYGSLPALGTIEIEYIHAASQWSFPGGSKLMFDLRLKIGRLTNPTLDTQRGDNVYAYVTMHENPHIIYDSQTVSASVGRRDGKVMWDKPFDDLDVSSSKASNRRAWFRAVMLHYLMASGELRSIRSREATFHENLRMACWKLYLREQARQLQQGAESSGGIIGSQSRSFDAVTSSGNKSEIVPATKSKGSKRCRKDEVYAGIVRAARGPSMKGPRSFQDTSDQETTDCNLSYAGLQADNATLKVQIKRLESMHTKKLDPAKKLVQTHEDVLKAKQEEIGKLRISNIKADLLIEKLVARLDNLHAENQVLKQSNKIMKDNVAARESDKESLIVEREGLRIANEDLSFRVSNLLAGQAKLRTKIEALEKEVNETKEKMQAHSQMVKDEDLDF